MSITCKVNSLKSISICGSNLFCFFTKIVFVCVRQNKINLLCRNLEIQTEIELCILQFRKLNLPLYFKNTSFLQGCLLKSYRRSVYNTESAKMRRSRLFRHQCQTFRTCLHALAVEEAATDQQRQRRRATSAMQQHTSHTPASSHCNMPLNRFSLSYQRPKNPFQLNSSLRLLVQQLSYDFLIVF